MLTWHYLYVSFDNLIQWKMVGEKEKIEDNYGGDRGSIARYKIIWHRVLNDGK